MLTKNSLIQFFPYKYLIYTYRNYSYNSFVCEYFGVKFVNSLTQKSNNELIQFS